MFWLFFSTKNGRARNFIMNGRDLYCAGTPKILETNSLKYRQQHDTQTAFYGAYMKVKTTT